MKKPPLAEYRLVVVISKAGKRQTVEVAVPDFTLSLMRSGTKYVDLFTLSGLDAEGRLVYRPEEPDAASSNAGQ